MSALTAQSGFTSGNPNQKLTLKFVTKKATSKNGTFFIMKDEIDKKGVVKDVASTATTHVAFTDEVSKHTGNNKDTAENINILITKLKCKTGGSSVELKDVHYILLMEDDKGGVNKHEWVIKKFGTTIVEGS